MPKGVLSKKKLSLFLAVILLVPAWPGISSGWTRKAHLLILEDALRFAPTRLRELVEAQAGPKGEELLIQMAVVLGEAPRDPDLVLGDAIRVLSLKSLKQEEKIRVLVELSRVVLEASSPTGISAETLDRSTSCFQAEWDGFDKFNRLKDRLEITRRALAPVHERLRAYGEDGGRMREASEALATCYHLAVNDLADALYSVWSGATQDTAAWFTSKGDRVWHRPEGGPLSLPRGFDPIPTLRVYYEGIGNSFVRKRIAKGQGVPPPPGSFYTLTMPLTLVTAKGQALIERWEADHPPATGETGPREEQSQSKAGGLKGRVNRIKNVFSGGSAIRERDLKEETEAKAPLLKPAGSESREDGVGLVQPNSSDRQAVFETMRGARPQILSAYKLSLNRGGGAGKVVAEFQLSPEGKVVGPVRFIEDQVGDPKLRADLTNIIKRLQFPSTLGKPLQVRYPIVFQSGG